MLPSVGGRNFEPLSTSIDLPCCTHRGSATRPTTRELLGLVAGALRSRSSPPVQRSRANCFVPGAHGRAPERPRAGNSQRDLRRRSPFHAARLHPAGLDGARSPPCLVADFERRPGIIPALAAFTSWNAPGKAVGRTASCLRPGAGKVAAPKNKKEISQ